MISELLLNLLYIGERDRLQKIYQGAQEVFANPTANVQEIAERKNVSVGDIQKQQSIMTAPPKEYNIGRGSDVQKARSLAEQGIPSKESGFTQLREGVYQQKTNEGTRVIYGNIEAEKAGIFGNTQRNISSIQPETNKVMEVGEALFGRQQIVRAEQRLPTFKTTTLSDIKNLSIPINQTDVEKYGADIAVEKAKLKQQQPNEELQSIRDYYSGKATATDLLLKQNQKYATPELVTQKEYVDALKTAEAKAIVASKLQEQRFKKLMEPELSSGEIDASNFMQKFNKNMGVEYGKSELSSGGFTSKFKTELSGGIKEIQASRGVVKGGIFNKITDLQTGASYIPSFDIKTGRNIISPSRYEISEFNLPLNKTPTQIYLEQKDFISKIPIIGKSKILKEITGRVAGGWAITTSPVIKALDIAEVNAKRFSTTPSNLLTTLQYTEPQSLKTKVVSKLDWGATNILSIPTSAISSTKNIIQHPLITGGMIGATMLPVVGEPIGYGLLGTWGAGKVASGEIFTKGGVGATIGEISPFILGGVGLQKIGMKKTYQKILENPNQKLNFESKYITHDELKIFSKNNPIKYDISGEFQSEGAGRGTMDYITRKTSVPKLIQTTIKGKDYNENSFTDLDTGKTSVILNRKIRNKDYLVQTTIQPDKSAVAKIYKVKDGKISKKIKTVKFTAEQTLKPTAPKYSNYGFETPTRELSTAEKNVFSKTRVSGQLATGKIINIGKNSPKADIEYGISTGQLLMSETRPSKFFEGLPKLSAFETTGKMEVDMFSGQSPFFADYAPLTVNIPKVKFKYVEGEAINKPTKITYNKEGLAIEKAPNYYSGEENPFKGKAVGILDYRKPKSTSKIMDLFRRKKVEEKKQVERPLSEWEKQLMEKWDKHNKEADVRAIKDLKQKLENEKNSKQPYISKGIVQSTKPSEMSNVDKLHKESTGVIGKKLNEQLGKYDPYSISGDRLRGMGSEQTSVLKNTQNVIEVNIPTKKPISLRESLEKSKLLEGFTKYEMPKIDTKLRLKSKITLNLQQRLKVNQIGQTKNRVNINSLIQENILKQTSIPITSTKTRQNIKTIQNIIPKQETTLKQKLSLYQPNYSFTQKITPEIKKPTTTLPPMYGISGQKGKQSIKKLLSSKKWTVINPLRDIQGEWMKKQKETFSKPKTVVMPTRTIIKMPVFIQSQRMPQKFMPRQITGRERANNAVNKMLGGIKYKQTNMNFNNKNIKNLI